MLRIGLPGLGSCKSRFHLPICASSFNDNLICRTQIWTHLPVLYLSPKASSLNDVLTILHMPHDGNLHKAASLTPKSQMHCELWKVWISATEVMFDIVFLDGWYEPALKDGGGIKVPKHILFGSYIARYDDFIDFMDRGRTAWWLPFKAYRFADCIGA